MNKERIDYVKKLLESVPRSPWIFIEGDDFDHWQIWSPTDGVCMVQDDSGVPPDTEFINFVIKSREIIVELLNQIESQ